MALTDHIDHKESPICTLMYFVHTINSVGRPKHVRVMAGALEGDIFIGPKAEVCLQAVTLLDITYKF